MIPRTARRGHSFNGAGLYYLHDKKAMTTDRVEWTHTHNLSTDDPEKAMKRMAYTSMNSEKLKHQNGVDKRGRKSTAGHVYSFSLAWHPEQTPDKSHMIEASLTLLEKLGLKDNHQAVLVAHQDEAHPHVHVICNLINKENGKTASTSNDRLIMSKWAEEYELEHGKIYCDSRVENNQKRKELSQKDVKAKRQEQQQDFENGDSKEKPETGIVKHRQSKHERSELIQNLYNQSDSGKAFRAALQEEGFTLARGDRRGFVLVDDSGKIHSLSRQLKGQRAKDLRNRLADLEDLKSPKEIVNEKQSFDREQATIDQQNKELDAADEHGKKTVEQEKKQERQQNAKRPTKEFEKPKRGGNEKEKKPITQKNIGERLREQDEKSGIEKLRDKFKEQDEEKNPVELAKAQSKKWFDIIDHDRNDDIRLSAVEDRLRQTHKIEDLEQKTKDLKEYLAKTDTFWGRKTGKHQKAMEELEAHQFYFEETKERIKVQMDKLKKELIENRPSELRPSNDDSSLDQRKESNVTDFDRAVEKKEQEDAFKERLRREAEEWAKEHDEDQGMDI